MVLFLDLDEDKDASFASRDGLFRDHLRAAAQLKLKDGLLKPLSRPRSQSDEACPITSTNDLAAAITCYPVALSLSSNLDLNDLHSLSLTSRAIHSALQQYAHQLVKHSLRCTFDSQPLLAELLAAHRTVTYAGEQLDLANIPSNILAAITSAQRTPLTDHLLGSHSMLFKSSKVGKCARDLVAACRKCGVVVCRNCAAKPPSDRRLKDRFRRLCAACLAAPLESHIQPTQSRPNDVDGPPNSSSSSTRSVSSISSSSSNEGSSDLPYFQTLAFTAPAFLRTPCNCAIRGVFLCHPCGQNLDIWDTTYKRVWSWRSRYSTHIGGLGTGIGEGNQGQKCGRGKDCLDQGGGGLCWVERDCCEEQNQENQEVAPGQSRPPLSQITWADAEGDNAPNGSDGDHINPQSQKPGYLQQEMEGVGGVVKKKVKKKLRVGATVWEFEDERESGKYLEREVSGEQRSWCRWCDRVVLSGKDHEEYRYEG